MITKSVEEKGGWRISGSFRFFTILPSPVPNNLLGRHQISIFRCHVSGMGS
jgi:hypothetical protein